jgi:PII-like signaling protein
MCWGASGRERVIQEREGALLRIFLGDAERHHGRPLHQVLVERAREAGLAGATVLHGPMGFGRQRQVHSAKLIEAAEDLPIVIEIVDSDEAIRRFLSEAGALVRQGLVTLEKVRILSVGESS